MVKSLTPNGTGPGPRTASPERRSKTVNSKQNTSQGPHAVRLFSTTTPREPSPLTATSAPAKAADELGRILSVAPVRRSTTATDSSGESCARSCSTSADEVPGIAAAVKEPPGRCTSPLNLVSAVNRLRSAEWVSGPGSSW